VDHLAHPKDALVVRDPLVHVLDVAHDVIDAEERFNLLVDTRLI
jgi:hypothetical protein